MVDEFTPNILHNVDEISVAIPSRKLTLPLGRKKIGLALEYGKLVVSSYLTFKKEIMLHFKYSSLINAPVEVVWNFHERLDILQKLTPPWQPVQIVRRQGGLEVGAVSEFRLLLGPIPVKWVALHAECVPYQLFTDEQQEGPMASWTHRHQFSEENGKTRLTDAIAFSLPGGWLANILLSWWVDARLQDMFRYRHQVTKRECESSYIN